MEYFQILGNTFHNVENFLIQHFNTDHERVAIAETEASVLIVSDSQEVLNIFRENFESYMDSTSCRHTQTA